MSKDIGAIFASIATLIVLLYVVINVPAWIEPTGLTIEPFWIVLISIVILVAIAAGIYSLFR
ncbi:MAG TPA: hypothetical protein O0Y06_07880 [Methanocorpusculum sp.]|nr:hypothetical protein [Methanocorpusculum sp.]HJK80805.1 hypothetical protein [Methanocorpusculum sp.]